MDLKTLSEYSSIIKFADDTTVLVPQYSSVSMEEEFQQSRDGLLPTTVASNYRNVSKTKELVLRRPSARHFITPCTTFVVY